MNEVLKLQPPEQVLRHFKATELFVDTALRGARLYAEALRIRDAKSKREALGFIRSAAKVTREPHGFYKKQ